MKSICSPPTAFCLLPTAYCSGRWHTVGGRRHVVGREELVPGVRGRRVRGSPQRTTDHGRLATDNPLLRHVDHEDFLLGRRTPQ